MLLVDAFSSSEALGMGSSVSSSGGAAATATFALGPDVKVLTPDGRQVEPGSDEIGVLVLGRAESTGLLQGRAEVGRHLPDHRRRAVLGSWRLRPSAGATDHPSSGAWLGLHQYRRRKGLSRRGRRGAEAHPDVRDAVVVGVPHPTYGEQIVAVGRASSDVTSVDEERRHRAREGAPGQLQGPAENPGGRHHRSRPQRQGRLRPTSRARPPSGSALPSSWRLVHALIRCTSLR